MPLNLSAYRGPTLPLPVSELLGNLEAVGFKVTPSGSANKTLRVQLGTEYVAYVNASVLSSGALLGYRFCDTHGASSNACPADFNLRRFGRAHGLADTSFNLRFDGRHAYLHILDIDAALVLLQPGTAQTEDFPAWVADVNTIRADGSLLQTTREALIQARVGQGSFRSGLLRFWDRSCAVTNLSTVAILRASHIKPWRCSTNEERLDSNNGLLLSPNLDALFDSGLLTFQARGEARISPLLDAQALQCLGPVAGLRKLPSKEQARYLDFHAEHVFRKV